MYYSGIITFDVILCSLILPLERVQDHRVVSVFGISVSWRQTHISYFHFIAWYPKMHHSQARVKRRPP